MCVAAAEHVVAPVSASADEEVARLENGVVVTSTGYRAAYAALSAGGWTGLSLPAAHGGQGMPQLVQNAFTEMVSGADLAFGIALISSVGGAKVGGHGIHGRCAKR